MGTPNKLLDGINERFRNRLDYLTFQSFEQVLGGTSFDVVIEGCPFDFTFYKKYAIGPYSLEAKDRVRKIPVSRRLVEISGYPGSVQTIEHVDLLLKRGDCLRFYAMRTVYSPHSRNLLKARFRGMEMLSTSTVITDL